MKIFLVGFMGCGKTSLGKKLASMLGYRFVDMDREIERLCGMKIAEVFALHGEDHFRASEGEVLATLAQEEGNIVISTGGGAPCQADNMDIMNSAGRSVYLRMSPEKLVRRLEHGRDKRPKIQGMTDQELMSYIRQTLPGREDYYNLAHLVIDCDGVSDEYICRHIEQYLDKLS